jgi:protein SCO1/2
MKTLPSLLRTRAVLAAAVAATLAVTAPVRLVAAAPAPAPGEKPAAAACCPAPETTAAAKVADAPAACCTAAEAKVAAVAAPAPDAKPSCCAEAPPPAAPVGDRSIYQLDATWTNDAAAPVKLVSFRGQPVVVAMIFAQCEYACPVLVNDLKRLRAALPPASRELARFALVSFDTARDTPAALRTFRRRMELDERWTLLRGDTDAVAELAMLLGVKYKADARGQFAHSNQLTVLDAGGEIVHQLAGLNSDVSETARVLARLLAPGIAHSSR